MNKNVLLVDDDDIVNFVNTRLLNAVGVQDGIHVARNGVEALELINGYFAGAQSLPDVILLDLNMPVMDGFSFVEAFKRLSLPKKETTMIIVLTSSDSPQDRKRAKDLGIENYIVKPVTQDAITRILEERSFI